MPKEILFECPYFSVSKEPIEYTNGTKSIYYTIDGDDFVVIIPKLDDNTYVAVTQPRLGKSFYTYEFPAGAIHKGESPIFAAIRELQEESGYTPGTITLIGSFKPIVSRSNMTGYVFLATELKEGKQQLDLTECDLEVLKLTEEELANSIKCGKFIDGSSLSAITILNNYERNVNYPWMNPRASRFKDIFNKFPGWLICHLTISILLSKFFSLNPFHNTTSYDFLIYMIAYWTGVFLTVLFTYIKERKNQSSDSSGNP